MLALAGPDRSDMPGAGDTGSDTTTEHTIDPATGETRITILQKDGIATLRSGANVPVTLPEGFSLLAGARVFGNSLVSRPGGWQNAVVTFETDAPAVQVIAHYREQAKAAGLAITLEAETGNTFIMVAERGATKVSATATRGTPTTGQLVIGNGKAD